MIPILLYSRISLFEIEKKKEKEEGKKGIDRIGITKVKKHPRQVSILGNSFFSTNKHHTHCICYTTNIFHCLSFF